MQNADPQSHPISSGHWESEVTCRSLYSQLAKGNSKPVRWNSKKLGKFLCKWNGETERAEQTGQAMYSQTQKVTRVESLGA